MGLVDVVVYLGLFLIVGWWGGIRGFLEGREKEIMKG